MIERGLDAIEVGDDEVVPLLEDYPSEWLKSWAEAAPKLRNIHAHGTTSLWPTVQGTFENVMDAINQLWESEASAE
jgi:hypothetical protein